MRFWTEGEWNRERALAAEACLLGERPLCMTVVVCGVDAYVVESEHVVVNKNGCFVDGRKKTGRQAYEDMRRLPMGMAVVASHGGIAVCRREDVDISAATEIRELPDFLPLVLTAKEGAERYGLSADQVESDCEEGAFLGGTVRKSDGVWLVTTRGLSARYGKNECPMEEEDLFCPLLFVFTLGEASKLWHRPREEVRSAAAGAGHRNARMNQEETGKSGKTRLVTRVAMERVFGPVGGSDMKAVGKELGWPFFNIP